MGVTHSNWKVPGQFTDFDLRAGRVGLASSQDKIVIIAQKLPAGTAEQGKVYEILNTGQAKELFGAKSAAFLMANAMMGANNRARFYVAPVEDSTNGTKPTKTITVSLPAGGTNGLIRLWAGNRKIEAAVSATSSATGIAANIAEQINADDYIPFTAEAQANIITLTSVNAGTVNYTASFFAETADTNAEINFGAITMGGANPDIEAIITALEPGGFSIFVHHFIDQTEIVKEKITMFSDGYHQNGAIQVLALTDRELSEENKSASILQIKETATQDHNDWRDVLAFVYAVKSSYIEISAGVAAAIAMQDNPGSPVIDYKIAGLDVPEKMDILTTNEMQSLMEAGVTCLYEYEGQLAIKKAITTYTKSGDGAVIRKLMEILTPRSLDYLRLNLNNMYKVQYKNKKNTQETRDNIGISVYGILKQLEAKPFEITQKVDEYRSGIIVAEDPIDPAKALVTAPSDIVMGLDIIDTTIQLL